MHLFFSTPVWTSKVSNYDSVNKEILEYILMLKKSDSEGITKSNFNGWHSKDFNLAREATLDSGLSPQTPAYDVQQA